jgi:glycosyltransferase involved in cell wall biosynthesis
MSVSIAMAVYNGEKYIKKQLDSILNQLTKDDEIIVSYDRSTDNTLKIIDEYQLKYSQVKLYYNDYPGITGNFNNAISRCSGDYIFISDQDDIWENNKIKIMLEAFNATGADVICHNGKNINAKDEIISDDFFKIYKIRNGIIMNFIRPRYSGCCMAFNRTILKKIYPIPLDIGGYDHWLGMIGEIYGKMVFIDDILIFHRIHGENVTPIHRRKIHIILKSRSKLLKEILLRK